MASLENSSSGPILVTGANGYVGGAVVRALVNRDMKVIALTRNRCTNGTSAIEWLAVGDLTAIADWPGRFSGVDTIVHCAARAHVLKETASDPEGEFRRHNTDLVAAMARGAAEAGVRRFVFISSIGVNGDATGKRAFRHDDPPRPHSAYARAKLAAEEALQAIAAETGLEVVIIRPPLVLGRDAKGNLGSLAKAVRSGLPLPFGLARQNRRDLVSLDTLADLVATAVSHPAAAGEIFLVADGNPLSTRDIVGRIGQMEGRAPRLVAVPTALLAAGLRLLGKGSMASQLFGNLEIDIAHTRQTLGWTPSVREVSR